MTTTSKPGERPQPAHHSDNEKSRMPERDDKERDIAPHDKPGAEPGKGEAPVG